MSTEIIKEYLKNVPTVAGIYQMFDAGGNVIYIGKAKNLRNRLANYTVLRDQTERIQQMIMQVRKVETIKTTTELEALLLEANLIRKFKPRYNILLKDSKSFPYLLIREDHPYPQIAKYRGIKDIKGTYYGPFTSPQKVDETMTYLEKAFLLRSCSDHYFATRKRPCLLYQIKRCSAPCVGKVVLADYLQLVKQTKDFLAGKNTDLQKDLAEKMQEASDRFDYERAAQYRDRIKVLSYIQSKQMVEVKEIGDADIIGALNIGGVMALQIFFFRMGQNLGNKIYFPEHAENASVEEVLRSFLLYYYPHNQVPPSIILSQSIEEPKLVQQALQAFSGRKVTIEVPKQGKKFELIKFVLNNIRYDVEKNLENKSYHTAMLKEVQLLFDLPHQVKRIEIYDNSHIAGKFAVGAMVVAGENGFEKNEYRKYNINLTSKSSGGDDYLMMKDVLSRRFKRDLPKPDLILIDGGAGHLSTAMSVLKELEQDIYAVGIAKGPERNAGKERFFTVDKGEFTLDRDNKVMKYLQILRDEAHRFAIKTHRAKRSKAIKTSVLDQIDGIGSKRKKILLNHFGSVTNIENATIEQLQQIDTISKKIAEKIFRHFH
jgi:excinuclease ABC subunit C